MLFHQKYSSPAIYTIQRIYLPTDRPFLSLFVDNVSTPCKKQPTRLVPCGQILISYCIQCFGSFVHSASRPVQSQSTTRKHLGHICVLYRSFQLVILCCSLHVFLALYSNLNMSNPIPQFFVGLTYTAI